jgi:hypothetical protein
MNTTQGQEDFRCDTDPFAVVATHCTDCSTTMDEHHVFAGLTLIHRHLQESIAQTVSCTIVIHCSTLIKLLQCPNCHHTKFHTPVYEFTNAEALLVWIQACQNRLYISPPHARSTTSSSTSAYRMSRQKNQLRQYSVLHEIQSDTYFKATRTMCGNCCKGAQISASTANTACQKCNIHHVDTVTPTIMGILSQAVPAFSPPSGTLMLTQPAPAFSTCQHPASCASECCSFYAMITGHCQDPICRKWWLLPVGYLCITAVSDRL